MTSFRLGVLLALVLAAPASATPTFTLSHEAAGPLDRFPATVVSRLDIRGTDVEERFRLSATGRVAISGDARVVRSAILTPAFRRCPGRWQRFHSARQPREVLFDEIVLPPHGRATAVATDSIVRPPWQEEDALGAAFEITPAGGSPMTVATPGPFFSGPLGVQLRISETANRIVVATTPVVNSGRIVLRAYRSMTGRSVHVATLPVRGGIVSTRWTPRPGTYELYALFRPSNSSFGADATECGTILRVRPPK